MSARGKSADTHLILSARDSVHDIVRGLDLGVVDYMTEPFSFDELVARLRAVKRRAIAVQDPNLRGGDLSLIRPAGKCCVENSEYR